MLDWLNEFWFECISGLCAFVLLTCLVVLLVFYTTHTCLEYGPDKTFYSAINIPMGNGFSTTSITPYTTHECLKWSDR